MMPEIQRILYATDLSDNSAYAFRYAINSATKHDAKIVILHVLEELPSSAQAMMQFYFTKEQQEKMLDETVTNVLDRIRKRLEVFCQKELNDNPESMNRIESIQVCRGYPADEILKKVGELECDAIVMGTHGKGIIRDTYLGSMTKKVLRRVRKPVFIIPLPRGETDITFHDF
ncbi:MAG: universal stress protein [Deltaproteobacteria bacterium]|nr:universal stress protein [Deltaproteobacteria bacterium]MBW2050023.1 universal stress protein [Deltaproteobacteria bacterium]MBW2112407.1 universal stress protein [Deltaproteobacteria bacterium]MBW2352446.1 universal stress protein [Deltaproteobacteria bacterium]HDZ24260.1 universal stress protein [Desulfobacteraceae bacterium]